MRRKPGWQISQLKNEFGVGVKPGANTIRNELSHKVKNFIHKRANKSNLLFSLVVVLCMSCWFFQSMRTLEDYLLFRTHKITEEGFDLVTTAPAITFCVNRLFDFDVIDNFFPNWTHRSDGDENKSMGYREFFEALLNYQFMIKEYQIRTLNAISPQDMARLSINVSNFIGSCLVFTGGNITYCEQVFGRPHTFYFDTNKCITYNYEADKLRLFHGDQVVFFLNLHKTKEEQGE